MHRKRHEKVIDILNSKQELKKRLHIAIPICIFIGLYFPTLLAAILTGEEHYYNPFVLIRSFFTAGSVWKLSILISVSLILAVAYIIVQTWKDKLYEDKLGKKRQFSLDYQPYGDAHWAEPCEYSNMAKIRPITECKGTVLGQLTSDGTQCVDMFKPPRINKHVLAVGSSGAGKSFTLVMPFILQAVKQRHSVIVTDPKGELYSEMAGYLQDHGYVVRRFDLITLAKSDGWDCMKYLRGLKGDELETNAQIFATIIVTNIEAEESVYSRGSIALLKAMILYVILEDSIPENEKTMAKINKMLQQEGIGYFETIFGKNASEKIKPAKTAYNTFKQASPNLYGNIVSHLATGMQIIQTSSVEKILATDDIDLNLPGDQPCAYFCRFSATNSTFRFVSAMFFSMLFISLIDHADRQDTRKLTVPVDFVMDEFPSIGKIPDWLEKISNIRSYGITAIMIVQGLSQIRGIYGDDATMIIGNCGTILNIGMNDEETAEWFQNRMGVTSIVVSTQQLESGMQEMRRKNLLGRESKGVGKDYLMSVSDIYDMSVDDTIIIFQHCNPIYAHKVPITSFPEYQNCRKINDKDIPDFDDKEARRIAREEETRKIEAYNSEHPYVEQTEDETYEEPVDFSSMSTTAILKLVVREDIRDIKKRLNKDGEVPGSGSGKPQTVFEILRERFLKDPKDKKPLGAEIPQQEPGKEVITNAGKDFSIFLDDDEDLFADLPDEKPEVRSEEPKAPIEEPKTPPDEEPEVHDTEPENTRTDEKPPETEQQADKEPAVKDTAVPKQDKPEPAAPATAPKPLKGAKPTGIKAENMGNSGRPIPLNKKQKHSPVLPLANTKGTEDKPQQS